LKKGSHHIVCMYVFNGGAILK